MTRAPEVDIEARMRTHRDDPPSSYLAACDIAERGGIAAQCASVIAALHRHARTRAMTTAEISVRTGLDRHAVARRMPDCERMGEAMRCEMRRCTISGRASVTWMPRPRERGENE